jgi:hypothetical protein
MAGETQDINFKRLHFTALHFQRSNFLEELSRTVVVKNWRNFLTNEIIQGLVFFTWPFICHFSPTLWHCSLFCSSVLILCSTYHPSSGILMFVATLRSSCIPFKEKHSHGMTERNQHLKREYWLSIWQYQSSSPFLPSPHIIEHDRHVVTGYQSISQSYIKLVICHQSVCLGANLLRLTARDFFFCNWTLAVIVLM